MRIVILRIAALIIVVLIVLRLVLSIRILRSVALLRRVVFLRINVAVILLRLISAVVVLRHLILRILLRNRIHRLLHRLCVCLVFGRRGFGMIVLIVLRSQIIRIFRDLTVVISVIKVFVVVHFIHSNRVCKDLFVI